MLVKYRKVFGKVDLPAPLIPTIPDSLHLPGQRICRSVRETIVFAYGKYFCQPVLRAPVDFKMLGYTFYDYSRHNIGLVLLEHIAKGMFYSQGKPTSKDETANRYRVRLCEI